MKKLIGVFAILFAFGLTSCKNDKCLTCTYTDSNGNLVTTPGPGDDPICGDGITLDLAEASLEAAASFAGGTNFSCTRN